MVYKWTKTVFPVAADIAAEHIKTVEEKHGYVTRKNLLDSARPEESAIHECYEWNDDVAAEKYREHQSGQILSSLTVVASTSEKKEVPVRAFFNVAVAPDAGRYTNLQSVLSDDGYRAAVIGRFKSELKSITNRMRNFDEFSEIVAFLDEKV